VVALLGPNGAGKTTTVETLEGYRRPTAGTVEVLGLHPRRDHAALRARIGVMLQSGGVYPGMSPTEALHLFASYYDDPADPKELLNRVGLTRVRTTPWRRLSGGEQQRLALALALIGKPEVAFLDEPTAGLDPQSRIALWELLGELHAAGQTILLTTHYMEEADRLCHRVAIMDHGKILALDTPAGLKRSLGAEAVVRVGVEGDLRRLAGQLATLEGARSAQVSEAGVLVYLHGPVARTLPKIFATAEADGYTINDLSVTEPTLETVFLTLTGKDLRE
jgi:ABC-2 type transport system ATP-binding protein